MIVPEWVTAGNNCSTQLLGMNRYRHVRYILGTKIKLLHPATDCEKPVSHVGLSQQEFVPAQPGKQIHHRAKRRPCINALRSA